MNNFLLARFLGVCPFLGVTGRLPAAAAMGGAVSGVMLGVTLLTWPIYHWILVPLEIAFLQYVVFILVVACLVQLLEQVMRRLLPGLYRTFGVYLALITTNCAVLGLALLIILRQFTFLESFVFALGAGAGFTLAMVIMSGLREETRQSEVPAAFRGAAISLITAGILAMAFMGFSGMAPL